MRRLAPSVPAARILHSATLAGAEALGFASELGSIEAGKRAQLIAVRVPAAVADVEEYLLSRYRARIGAGWIRVDDRATDNRWPIRTGMADGR